MSFSDYFQDLSTVNLCLKQRDELLNGIEILDLKNKLKTSSGQEKKFLGQQLNNLKKQIQLACDAKIQAIQATQNKDDFIDFDPTFYSQKYFSSNGSLHPLTLLTKEIVEIFEKMGFELADGPLVETQDFCFTKLNMPSYHPARSMQDTFFLEEKDKIGENYVLRTHTTSVQSRYGSSNQPPFKIISPGAVFRNEDLDATHDAMFHQIECFVVDKEITLSHLRTLIQDFYNQFFESSNLQVRFRPSYFPYTIPSLEVDISNPFKGKTSGKIGSQDWIEAGGAGLVHPQVLKNFNIDPNEWQGLAFGFGIDRMVQIKLGISRLDQFFSGNLKFIRGVEL